MKYIVLIWQSILKWFAILCSYGKSALPKYVKLSTESDREFIDRIKGEIS